MEFVCVTRKIEVHLHRHNDDEDGKMRLEKEYQIWNAINDNLYMAANRVVSHLFFNDAYDYRMRIHSPEYQAIEKALKGAKKNKLSNEEISALKKRRNELFKEFAKQKQLFLSGGEDDGKNKEQNSTYKVVSKEFLEVIPSNVLTCLNQDITSTYKNYSKEIAIGKRTLPNFKRGLPVPFPMKLKGVVQLQRRSDGSIFVRFPMGLEWDLFFGRDKSNNKEIVERVLSGQYDVGNSSIQEGKNGKKFLLLVVKMPKQPIALDRSKVVGVDLGINVPLYAALSDNEYGGISIGSREQFLKMRMRMAAKKRELQQALRYTANGGHGRKQKLQALDRLEGKERNWVHLQNHIFSKTIIEYALKNNAGVIQMEDLSGFGRNKNDEVDDGYKFILRYWSFFELQQLIQYKADAVGIEVKFVNPYHTSQMCSFCGHYEKGQRKSQAVFECKNPKCEKGKGKKMADGTYKGINADWNAARNIALSVEFVDKKKK